MNRKLLAAVSVVLGVVLQSAPVFAVGDAPSADFFEKAWQEAATSQAYGFTCKISASNPKVVPHTLTGDQKVLLDLTLAAIKRYKRVTQGTLIGDKHQVFASQTSFNMLRVVDQVAGGQMGLREGSQKVKEVTTKKGDFIAVDDMIYFRGTDGWKAFQDAEMATTFYDGAAGSPFTDSLEKSSFVFGSRGSSGNLYNGMLTAKEMTSLLTPFLGEDEAKKLDPAPVKLFITGDGHIKKFTLADKVVLGGLSFTIKEQCDLKLKGVKIKIPSDAASVDSDVGKQDFVELLRAVQ